MRYLFLTLMLFVAGIASAGDSGLYYDELRNGEGILMMRSGDTYVLYLFTYGAYECYYDDDVESVSKDCTQNGQRWFYATIEPEEDDVSVPEAEEDLTGLLYIAHGVNYPEGEPHDLIPFVHNVGKSYPVGKFAMRRNLGGWLMDIAPTGDYLDEDDPLFDRIFKFEKRLFEVDEEGATPK